MSNPEETPQHELQRELLLSEYKRIVTLIGHEADFKPLENSQRLGERLLNIEKYVYDLLKGGE